MQPHPALPGRSLVLGLGVALLAPPGAAQSLTFVGSGGAALDWSSDLDDVLIGGSPSYVYTASSATTTPLDPGGSGAVALSDAFSVLGTTPDPSGSTTSGIWAPGSWTSLGGVAGSGCPDLSKPGDLDDAGAVAVGLGWNGCSAFAYRWSSGTGMTALPQLGPNGARANVVSGDGAVIGGWDEDANGARRASVWYPGGEVLVNVTASNPSGFGEVWGLSTDGTWAVGSGAPRAGAFLYSPLAGNRDLGLPGPLGPLDACRANAVSDDGKVVVGFQGSPLGTHPRAWIWTASDGISWLEDYLARVGLLLPGVVVLTDAARISADGTTILCTLDTGPSSPQSAVLVTIPPQADWSKYGLGAAPANTLDLDGGGTTQVGGTFSATVSGIAPGSTLCATGVSTASSSLPLLGGVVLVDVGKLLLVSTADPGGTGTCTHAFPIPPTPGLFGVTVYFQSVADDPSLPELVAFSNGLAAVLGL